MANVILIGAATISIAAFLAVPDATAQSESEARQFKEMAAYLSSNDAERKTAIATCIAKGIGDNPTGAAKVMGVPAEEAATAWCTRSTNGIANGKLGLHDLTAVNKGKITPAMLRVLKGAPE